MKIKEYILVLGDYDDFEKRINDRIDQQYHPYGNIVIDDNMTLPLRQAMVKYEEEPLKTQVKERRVVDVIDVHSMPTIDAIIQIRDELIIKGWSIVEQGHKEFIGWYLKMVKYK